MISGADAADADGYLHIAVTEEMVQSVRDGGTVHLNLEWEDASGHHSHDFDITEPIRELIQRNDAMRRAVRN